MRVAELCAGYGGLFAGLRAAGLPVELAWYAEVDSDASKLLAHHHPGVANIGDITNPGGFGPYGLPRRHLTAPRRARQAAKRNARQLAAWKVAAEPVHILAGGFPCQSFSLAGKRLGAKDRRHLWPTGVLPAVKAFLPPVLLFENVEGLRTIDRGEVFRVILRDLDALGYTVRWTTLGACKLGLCHHRHRLFILATRQAGELPPELGMPIGAWSSWPRDGVCHVGEVWAEPYDGCGATGITLPTPTASDGGSRGTGLGSHPDPEGRPLREVIAMLPTPTTSDGAGGAGHDGRDGAPNLRTAVTLLPTPLAHAADRGISSPDGAADRMASGRRMLDDAVALLPTPRAGDGRNGGPNQRGSSGDLALPAAAQPERWGQYAAAVGRHEAIIGRPAPDPTITGGRGGRRLNPALTEFMMGLPVGHITGPIADPNAANRIAGNGCVPQVVAAAVQRMVRRGQLDLTTQAVTA